MDLVTVYFIAVLLGFGPTLLWLLFWLKEDEHPEPKALIFRSFIAGMVVIMFAFEIERYILNLGLDSTSTIFWWATTEEVLKFLAAWLVVLRIKAVNEPVDAVIYTIAVALGFAALENTLFVFNQINTGDITGSFMTQGLRFLGATVLHTVCSALVGLGLAFTFWRGAIARTIGAGVGLFAAILLHYYFNFFIINVVQGQIFTVFGIVWISAVVLILLIERVRLIKRPAHRHQLVPSTNRLYAKR